MSSNVEDYGVKVRFDNEDFDKNIESSDQKLNQFKDTLNSLPSNVAEGLDGLKGKLSAINLGEIINFAAITTGIHSIRAEIEDLADPIESLAEKALNVAENTIAQIVNQIKAGGEKRAQNIEDAEFQLKGLNLEVDTFMTAANYAVKGTAYGLDAAAKVASQLGASGITQLDELKKALRAISGVAAMTNSEFSEIGRIFTFAASYGKITSRQLMMLSTRGINATATMAKALGKTEQEVREMMSQGKVNFKMFYEAMDDAFGEHAKRANETFTGSMRNIKAALSRIGADWFTPLHKTAIPIFNDIQAVFNQLKASITDNGFYKAATDMMDKIGKSISTMLNYFTDTLENSRFLKEVVDTVSKSFEYLTNLVTKDFSFGPSIGGQFMRIFNGVANAVYIARTVLVTFMDSFDQILKPKVISLWDRFLALISSFGNEFKFTEEEVAKMRDTFDSWMNVIKTIPNAFENIFGHIDWRDISSKIKEVLRSVFDFITNLKASDDTIDKFQRTFDGLVAVLDIARMLLSAIVDLLKPAAGLIEPIAGFILNIAANIGDALKNLRDTIKAEDTFAVFFENIFDAVKNFFGFLGKVGGSIIDIFFGEDTKDFTFVQKIGEFFKKVGNTIADFVGNIKIGDLDLTPIQNFIRTIFTLGFTQDEEAKIDDDRQWYEKGIFGLLMRIGQFVQQIKDFFGNKEGKSLTEAGDVVEDAEKAPNIITKIITWISDLITNITQNADPALLTAGTLAGIAVIIDSIAKLVEVTFAGLANLIKVIIAADFFAFLKKYLTDKKNNMDPINKFLDGITGSLNKLTSPMQELGETIKKFRTEGIVGLNKKSFAEEVKDILISIALLLVAMAGALYIVSLVPADKMSQSVGALAALAGIITGVVLGFGLIANGLSLFNKHGNILNTPILQLAAAIDMMAAALVMIATSLLIVSMVDDTNGHLGDCAAIIEFCLAGIAGILLVFGVLSKVTKVDPIQFIEMAGAIAIISLALYAIAIALIGISSVMSNDPDDKRVLIAAGIAVGILTAVALVLGVFTALAAQNPGAVIASGVALLAVMIGVSAAIAAVGKVMQKLSRIENLEGAIDAITVIFIGVGLIATILTAVGGLLGSTGPQALIGMGIVVLILFTLAENLLAIGVIMKQATKAIEAVTKFIKTFKELVELFSDMDDEKTNRVLQNGGKILLGVFAAIPVGIGVMIEGAIVQLHALAPKLIKAAAEILAPLVSGIPNEIFPKLIVNLLSGASQLLEIMIQFAPTLLTGLYDLLFGSGQVYVTILEYMDKMWDDTVDWLKERIPIWVEDIAEIILILIKAINATLDKNWEELDKETQALIDKSLVLIGDLLTGQQTTQDLGELIGKLIGSLSQAVTENMPVIVEAFKDMGRSAIGSFVDALLEGMPADFEIPIIGDWLDNLDASSSGLSIVNPSATSASNYANYMPSGYSSGWTTSGDTSGVIGANTNATRNDAHNGVNSSNWGNNKGTNVNVNVRTTTESDPYGLARSTTSVESEQGKAGIRNGNNVGGRLLFSNGG